MPDWQDLGSALGLMLIFEGLLPFLSPNRSKQVFATMAQADPKGLRLMGISVIVCGLLLLALVR